MKSKPAVHQRQPAPPRLTLNYIWEEMVLHSQWSRRVTIGLMCAFVISFLCNLAAFIYVDQLYRTSQAVRVLELNAELKIADEAKDSCLAIQSLTKWLHDVPNIQEYRIAHTADKASRAVLKQRYAETLDYLKTLQALSVREKCIDGNTFTGVPQQ